MKREIGFAFILIASTFLVKGVDFKSVERNEIPNKVATIMTEWINRANSEQKTLPKEIPYDPRYSEYPNLIYEFDGDYFLIYSIEATNALMSLVIYFNGNVTPIIKLDSHIVNAMVYLTEFGLIRVDLSSGCCDHRYKSIGWITTKTVEPKLLFILPFYLSSDYIYSDHSFKIESDFSWEYIPDSSIYRYDMIYRSASDTMELVIQTDLDHIVDFKGKTIEAKALVQYYIKHNWLNLNFDAFMADVPLLHWTNNLSVKP